MAKGNNKESKGITLGQPNNLVEMVDYQSGAIVSRTILDKPAGTVTLFAFGKDQGLSEHTAPFDALVQILDGEATVTISGESYHLTKDEKKTLITYRLERSRESLKAAELMFENKLFIPAMNRIYYSMFYAVQALLIINESTFSKHGQVKGFFNKEYIKPGIFPKEFGKLYNAAFEYCQKFDYVDLIIPEQELVSDYIPKAKTFIEKLSEYINEQI